jgi:hypothetical protein
MAFALVFIKPENEIVVGLSEFLPPTALWIPLLSSAIQLLAVHCPYSISIRKSLDAINKIRTHSNIITEH